MTGLTPYCSHRKLLHNQGATAQTTKGVCLASRTYPKRGESQTPRKEQTVSETAAKLIDLASPQNQEFKARSVYRHRVATPCIASEQLQGHVQF